jgi:hypothetical protein
VQAFWLLSLGVLFLGIWPGPGVPPAWRTGKAEPWPSQAELAEQRRAARGGGGGGGGRGGGRAQPQPSPQPEAPQRSAPVPASAKRKRKRRR